MRAEVKDAYWKIFDTEDLTTGPSPDLVEIIGARISEMAARYGPAYPSAMKCLTTDAEGLTAYLWFPAEHRHRIRHSNFIERTFGEAAGESRSSAASPARPAASPWSGPCSTVPPAAGAGSP